VQLVEPSTAAYVPAAQGLQRSSAAPLKNLQQQRHQARFCNDSMAVVMGRNELRQQRWNKSSAAKNTYVHQLGNCSSWRAPPLGSCWRQLVDKQCLLQLYITLDWYAHPIGHGLQDSTPLAVNTRSGESCVSLPVSSYAKNPAAVRDADPDQRGEQ
jgi:hypothetical protein